MRSHLYLALHVWWLFRPIVIVLYREQVKQASYWLHPADFSLPILHPASGIGFQLTEFWRHKGTISVLRNLHLKCLLSGSVSQNWESRISWFPDNNHVGRFANLETYPCVFLAFLWFWGWRRQLWSPADWPYAADFAFLQRARVPKPCGLCRLLEGHAEFQHQFPAQISRTGG